MVLLITMLFGVHQTLARTKPSGVIPTQSPSGRNFTRSPWQFTFRPWWCDENIRENSKLLLLAWHGQKHQPSHPNMSQVPSEKEAQPCRTSTAVTTAAVHWTQPKSARWSFWATKNFWSIEKVHFMHDRCIFQICWTSGLTEQRISHCGHRHLWKIDLLSW